MNNLKPIPGYDGYFLDGSSNVFSSRKGGMKMLKPWKLDGYPTVKLCINCKDKTIAIHRLVALAFLGPRQKGYEVMHLDGTRDNNHISNLRYGTNLENQQQRRKDGTMLLGEKSPKAKLTCDKVLAIRQSKLSGRQIAKAFGVTHSNVQAIKKFKTWKHCEDLR